MRVSGFLQIEGNIRFAANDFLALLFDISLISLKQDEISPRSIHL